MPPGASFLCKRVGSDALSEGAGEADRERYTVAGPVGAGMTGP